MPQAYQARTGGYLGNAMTRPGSAAGKRGGRRPKEFEEYVRRKFSFSHNYFIL